MKDTEKGMSTERTARLEAGEKWETVREIHSFSAVRLIEIDSRQIYYEFLLQVFWVHNLAIKDKKQQNTRLRTFI